MQRHGEKHMQSWFNNKRRRKPLLLRGARQVGKSTLVRNFAQQHNLSLNEVNLERYRELDQTFATMDTSLIKSELEGLFGQSLLQPDSLLFLDEIQATPSAIPALRYLYEDFPELPVVAAGSLVEFTLADHSFSMPVGRIQYLHLGPMTFSEFLQELEPDLHHTLDTIDLKPDKLHTTDLQKVIPDTLHKRLMARQRQYLFTGGMPEAVLAFSETGSMEESSQIHRDIINTYQDDFAKYARQTDLMLLQRVFRTIPSQVGNKVKYSNFSTENRALKVKTMIDLLEKARVCYRVNACSCDGLPLNASINEKVFKLIFMDVGLMNHVNGLRWRDINGMNDTRLVNEGALAEQFIGQHLAFMNQGLESPQLTYWLREHRSGNAEVDYVMVMDGNIVPVEVKAGRSGKLRSLHQFALTRGAKLALRFDANPPGVQDVTATVQHKGESQDVKYRLVSLPLYAVG